MKPMKLNEDQQLGYFSLCNSVDATFKFQPVNEVDLKKYENLEFDFIGNLATIPQKRNPQNKSQNYLKKLCALSGSKIFQFLDLSTSQIEAVVDISFCLYEEFQEQDYQSSSCNSNIQYGFKLKRNKQTIKFLTESTQDRSQWKSCLQSYIVQSDINLDYGLSDVIGKGSYGLVYKGVSLQSDGPQEQQVAIKRLNKVMVMDSNQGVKSLMNEIQIHWAMTQCENVLKLIALYEDDTNVYLVLEYQRYGSLLGSIRKHFKFTENQIKNIMEQLLLALDFFHRKRVIHRDIKLDNILINQIEGDNYDVRIADFGIARKLKDEEQLIFQKCGTPGYVAPEVLRNVGYDFKADIFSLGVVFYNILTGKNIFVGQNQHEILKKNQECKIPQCLTNLKNISKNGLDLLLRMLQKEPYWRPSAQQALQHLWFKNDSVIISELLEFNSFMSKTDYFLQNKDSFNSFSSFVFASKLNNQAQNQNIENTDNPQCYSPFMSQVRSGQTPYSSNINNNNGSSTSVKINYYTAINQSKRSRSFSPIKKGLSPTKKSEEIPQFSPQRRIANAPHRMSQFFLMNQELIPKQSPTKKESSSLNFSF